MQNLRFVRFSPAEVHAGYKETRSKILEIRYYDNHCNFNSKKISDRIHFIYFRFRFLKPTKLMHFGNRLELTLVSDFRNLRNHKGHVTPATDSNKVLAINSVFSIGSPTATNIPHHRITMLPIREERLEMHFGYTA